MPPTRYKVNYDEVAPTYDERYARGAHPELVSFVHAFCSKVTAGAILEVGCGTGQWLKTMADSRVPAVGLDVSALMLARVRTLVPAARLVRGRAEQLPFRERSFRGVLSIHAVHHFDAPRQFIDEGWRVLDSGGLVTTVAMAPHDGTDRWYIYDYFEKTWETDCRRYPRTNQLATWMRDAGFRNVETRVAARLRHTLSGKEVLKDFTLGRRGTSQLALLDDEAYERGMQRIRAALDSTVHQSSSTFEVDLRLFGTTGYKT